MKSRSLATSYGAAKYVKNLRLIQRKTGWLYSAEKIVEYLNRVSCSNEHENIYLFDYRTAISDAIGKALDIDFTNKRLQTFYPWVLQPVFCPLCCKSQDINTQLHFHLVTGFA